MHSPGARGTAAEKQRRGMAGEHRSVTTHQQRGGRSCPQVELTRPLDEHILGDRDQPSFAQQRTYAAVAHLMPQGDTTMGTVETWWKF
jgi:hypothetical protein